MVILAHSFEFILNQSDENPSLTKSTECLPRMTASWKKN